MNLAHPQQSNVPEIRRSTPQTLVWQTECNKLINGSYWFAVSWPQQSRSSYYYCCHILMTIISRHRWRQKHGVVCEAGPLSLYPEPPSCPCMRSCPRQCKWSRMWKAMEATQSRNIELPFIVDRPGPQHITPAPFICHKGLWLHVGRGIPRAECTQHMEGTSCMWSTRWNPLGGTSSSPSSHSYRMNVWVICHPCHPSRYIDSSMRAISLHLPVLLHPLDRVVLVKLLLEFIFL